MYIYIVIFDTDGFDNRKRQAYAYVRYEYQSAM